MSTPLSPIILAKNADQLNQAHLFLQANLKNDIFDIYRVTNSKSLKYCEKLQTYLCPTAPAPAPGTAPYYSCNTDTIEDLGKNKYVVIEFINPTSFVRFNKDESSLNSLVGNKYYIRKITFHTPSYHYVSSATSAAATAAVATLDAARGLTTIDGKTKHNCMEIEFMCSMDIPIGTTADTSLIISVLCDVNMNETIKDEELAGSDYSTAFTTINNYVTDNKRAQLKNGGFRNSKYTFNCKDLFPKKKHFYKYDGTTFKTNSSGELKSAIRIVFEDSIHIPKVFYDNISALTTNVSCNDTLPINKFIHVTSEHNLVYSDTNIEFIVEDNKGIRKKNNINTLYVIIILFVLFLLIMLFFAWNEGILKNVMREIFKENLVVYQLIRKYI